MVNDICFIACLSVVLLSTRGDLSKLAFLTPGLWDRTGKAFWSAFFFELPFALFRVVPLILFAVVAVFYSYWGSKAKKIYKLKINEDNNNE
jgi:Na+/H+ antiporter NhaC